MSAEPVPTDRPSVAPPGFGTPSVVPAPAPAPVAAHPGYAAAPQQPDYAAYAPQADHAAYVPQADHAAYAPQAPAAPPAPHTGYPVQHAGHAPQSAHLAYSQAPQPTYPPAAPAPQPGYDPNAQVYPGASPVPQATPPQHAAAPQYPGAPQYAAAPQYPAASQHVAAPQYAAPQQYPAAPQYAAAPQDYAAQPPYAPVPPPPQAWQQPAAPMQVGGVAYLPIQPAAPVVAQPSGPVQIGGMSYLNTPATLLEAPAAPKTMEKAISGARVLTPKELRDLKAKIQSINVGTPVAIAFLGLIALAVGVKLHTAGWALGVVWLVASGFIIREARSRHAVLHAQIAGSNIVVKGGQVTTASSVAWRKRTTEVVIGYGVFRISRIAAYLALRRTPGTVGHHVGMALGIGIVAGVAAWAVSKKVIETRAATA